MRVSALQLSCLREKPEETIANAIRLLRTARMERAELVCLPELWLPESFALRRKGLIRELQDAAQRYKLHLVTGALPRKRDSRSEIASHLISPEGEILGTQAKVHLFRSQRDKYQPAKSLKPFKTKLGSIGILVCYDNVFPEAARRLVLHGADVILIPSRIVREGIEAWHLYLKVRALENRVPIVAPNVVEPPHFDGHSLIVELEHDSKRDIVYPKVTEASSREQVLTYDLDLTLSKKLREKRLAERRPELY